MIGADLATWSTLKPLNLNIGLLMGRNRASFKRFHAIIGGLWRNGHVGHSRKLVFNQWGQSVTGDLLTVNPGGSGRFIWPTFPRWRPPHCAGGGGASRVHLHMPPRDGIPVGILWPFLPRPPISSFHFMVAYATLRWHPYRHSIIISRLITPFCSCICHPEMASPSPFYGHFSPLFPRFISWLHKPPPDGIPIAFLLQSPPSLITPFHGCVWYPEMAFPFHGDPVETGETGSLISTIWWDVDGEFWYQWSVREIVNSNCQKDDAASSMWP